MGKVKQQLTEDMMLHPENYNNPEPTEEEYYQNKKELETLKKHNDDHILQSELEDSIKEYEDVQGLFDDFIDKHIVVARMPTDADKDEIESIIIDNKKDTL